MLKGYKSMEIGMEKTYGLSWVHRWETRCKFLTGLFSIFLISSLHSIRVLLGIYIGILIITLSMKLRLTYLVKNTLKLMVFILLMGLPIVLPGGFPLDKERLNMALGLGLKSLSGLYIMMVIFYTQPMEDFLASLSYLGVPDVMMSIMFIAWRYIFIIGDRLGNMYKSLVARLFKPSCNIKSLDIIAGLMGGILIKSLDTSDKVDKAMKSRGFNGKMPVSKPKEVGLLDIFKSLIIILGLIFLVLVERWWM